LGGAKVALSLCSASGKTIVFLKKVQLKKQENEGRNCSFAQIGDFVSKKCLKRQIALHFFAKSSRIEFRVCKKN
jgi:hypothetical protein